MMAEVSKKKRATAFLLCLFLGSFGIHRFYVRKVRTGLLQLVAYFSIFGTIWALIDLIMIIRGKFTDKEGKLLEGDLVKGGMMEKKRSVGITILSSIEILIGILGIPFYHWGLAFTIGGGSFFFLYPDEPGGSLVFGIGIIMLFIASFCLFAGWTGLRLLRLNPKARKANLVIVPIWLFIILGWAMSPIIQDIIHPTRWKIYTFMGAYEPTISNRIFLSVVCIGIITLPMVGISWYLTRPKIKEQFK